MTRSLSRPLTRRPACSGSRRRAGRRRSSRGPTARRARSITSGRSCCRAAAPCCSRSRRLTGGLDAAQVAVLDLQTGTRKILVRGGSHAHYVSSGHLVYAAAGTLRAVPFDLARLETRGTPVPVVPARGDDSYGGVDAVVAGDGTLAYVSGSGGRDVAHARVGGPPGPRDADPGAAARVCLSAAVTRWHARRGARGKIRSRTSGSGIWAARRSPASRSTPVL